MKSNSSLSIHFPDEIWLKILALLPIQTLILVSCTSWQLYQLSKDEIVWKNSHPLITPEVLAHRKLTYRELCIEIARYKKALFPCFDKPGNNFIPNLRRESITRCLAQDNF